MKTVAEEAHETMREIRKKEVEIKERSRIDRAKLSQLKSKLKGLLDEEARQTIDERLLNG